MVTVYLALCSFVVYVAVHKTAEIPQLQFITVVDTSFVAQRQILMVQSIQLRIWWSMSLFAGFPQVQTWIVSCDLTVAAVVARPRCAGLHVSTGAVCEKTVDFPLLLLHAGFAVH